LTLGIWLLLDGAHGGLICRAAGSAVLSCWTFPVLRWVSWAWS